MSLSCVRPGADFDFVFSLVTSPVVDFFNHVNMLYGTIAEFCTKETVSPCSQAFSLKSRTDLDRFAQCPVMSAGPRCAVFLSCRDRHALPNDPCAETADTSRLLFPALQVRVPLRRRDDVQEAYRSARARVRRRAHELGAVAPRRRGRLPIAHRSVARAKGRVSFLSLTRLTCVRSSQAYRSPRTSVPSARRSCVGCSESTVTSTPRTLTRSARLVLRVRPLISCSLRLFGQG